jgi:hypothetical protein
MLYSGFYGQEAPGEIYHQTMETGKTRIEGFVGGEIKESGRSCWNKLYVIQTLNG